MQEITMKFFVKISNAKCSSLQSYGSTFRPTLRTSVLSFSRNNQRTVSPRLRLLITSGLKLIKKKEISNKYYHPSTQLEKRSKWSSKKKTK
jgi:hypothetical protein